MDTKKLLISLNLLVASLAFSLELPYKIVYINPQSTVTSDGKFALFAVKEKVIQNGKETEDYFYRFGRIKKQKKEELEQTKADVVRIVSARVFGAFADQPDHRGYGPRLTQTSRRNVEGAEPKFGELIATEFMARKWSDVTVQKYNSNKGTYERNREIQKAIKDANTGIEAKLEAGLKAQLGANYKDKYRVYREYGGTSLISKNWGEDAATNPYENTNSISFDIDDPEEGLQVENSTSYYITLKDENVPNPPEYGASYTLRTRITLDKDGKANVKEISSEVKLPKDPEVKAVALRPLNAAEAKLKPEELQKVNDEAKAILDKQVAAAQDEGTVEAVPAAER
jgi:hypothetical protein